MPELPEVETTLRGIEPFVSKARLIDVVVRSPSLRWPIPVGDLKALIGQKINRIERRAKYLLLHAEEKSILLHLGMSGSLRVLRSPMPPGKHDHLDLSFKLPSSEPAIIRFNDPRRFGCCLVADAPILQHKLLCNLGPEPLSDEFDSTLLFNRSRRRRVPIKNLIMDGKVVVGVGNIYASESLFLAGIRPGMASKRLTRQASERLVIAIKQILGNAIVAGGTTLNDFTDSEGKPGYFSQQLQVYGRAGEACFNCGSTIKSQVLGQRSTFYCPQCQGY